MAAVFILGCTTSPTGRHQLVLFPDGEMAQIGTQAFTQVKLQSEPSRTADVQGYAQCIARRILAAAHQRNPNLLSDDQWEVTVFDEGTINAFALPGGKVGIHQGMVRFADNADQLAAVIGHEVGHVIAQHGNERLSQSVATQSALAVIELLTTDTQAAKLALAALGVGAQVGISLPHSRTQEKEADLIGLELMAAAGFNPQEAVLLWEKMARTNSARVPQFLSTHPNPKSRARELAAHLPAVKPTGAGVMHCQKPEVPETAKKAEG